MKLFIKDYYSKCDQMSRKLRIWSHFRKIFLMENFIFRSVEVERNTGRLKIEIEQKVDVEWAKTS